MKAIAPSLIEARGMPPPPGHQQDLLYPLYATLPAGSTMGGEFPGFAVEPSPVVTLVTARLCAKALI